VNDNTIIGHRFFTDGTVRPVYRDDQGQYILDDGGEKMCSCWSPRTTAQTSPTGTTCR